LFQQQLGSTLIAVFVRKWLVTLPRMARPTANITISSGENNCTTNAFVVVVCFDLFCFFLYETDSKVLFGFAFFHQMCRLNSNGFNSSHVNLEVAMQTQPTITLLTEEVGVPSEEKKKQFDFWVFIYFF
jgi:hypothetical protein